MKNGWFSISNENKYILTDLGKEKFFEIIKREKMPKKKINVSKTKPSNSKDGESGEPES